MQECLKSNRCFKTGQGRAHAEVDAVAEGDVPVGMPGDIEAVGIFKMPLATYIAP